MDASLDLPADWADRVLVLAGPTATGKSAVAVQLAALLAAEIVSVDSMQVYRGMDIGTAKPSPAVRARVPHHLIDVAELSETFDAAQFVRLARRSIAGILARGRLPILCGGTGLYFKGLLEGLDEAPPADTALRAELEATPLARLLGELAQRDPATYARIDRRNPRRVIRALEVIRLTGRPFSEKRSRWTGAADHAAGAPPAPLTRHSTLDTRPSTLPPHYGLARPIEELRRRIDARVAEMFRTGLVGETQHLLARGLSANRIAMQALGYRQVAEHLGGQRSLPETVELVKLRTRQFARRQMTWFRRQLTLKWIAVPSDQTAEAVAARLVEEWRQRGERSA